MRRLILHKFFGAAAPNRYSTDNCHLVGGAHQHARCPFDKNIANERADAALAAYFEHVPLESPRLILEIEGDDEAVFCPECGEPTNVEPRGVLEWY